MLIADYIIWHYSTALRGILVLLKNFVLATERKFYIWRHFKTLFSPWHRMSAKYMFPAKGFADKVANFITDVFVRLLAATIRSVIITAGLFAELVVVLFFAALFVIWALWPFVVFGYISKGFALVF